MNKVRIVNTMKKIKGIFLFLSLFPFLSLFSADYAENSVLSSGKWIQIQVKENAVYKLTYDEIKKMGINDPSKVKIYGYGAWMLDEDFKKPYIDDLPEVSVWISKGSDNIFNSGDYLLFYGRGTTKWVYNAQNDFFEHENNPYSTFGSYFLTEGDSGPKEMNNINHEPNVSEPWLGTRLTTFDDYALHEKDSIAIINSGRELFGESFVGKNNQNFLFTVPGITADQGRVKLSFAAAPKASTPVSLSIDGKNILTLNVNKPVRDSQQADLVTGIAIWTGEKEEQVVTTVSYNSSGQLIANLNYISLRMKRRLQFYDNYTFFRNTESLKNPVQYVIENASSQSLIWDITSNFDAGLVPTTREGSRLSFRADKDNTLREYVMVDYSKTFPTPQIVGEVKNQNLHNLPQMDMVIISPEVYFSQAEKLAERHRSTGLRVIVVQPGWIYNEFSSGTRDATAYRRFMKMFYDRATSEEEKPKYLLLFGDGIFDNRHLTKDALRMNPDYYLLTFQMRESVDESPSYGSDDYFGFLDDNEGLQVASDGIDLGIGRFPVSSVIQAENAVRKVLTYMDDNVYKEWKNRIIFTADNTDYTRPSSFCVHATQADTISQYIENYHPEYMVIKSYMDAFKTTDINGQKTIPDAKNKFLTNLKEGCFLLNYTGHGNTESWSAENMLKMEDVKKMNFEGLPLWITATCDFGWFDRTDKTSAGEEAFLNKNSGAIALFTTSRVVYSDNNARIHSRLIRNLFSKVNGKRLRLGDVLRRSKNEMKSDSNKLNYVLLGDPALELLYPNLTVQLEKINGEVIAKDKTYSFKALDRVVLEGKIVDESGATVNGFNGKIKTNVFDSRQKVNSIQTDDNGGHFSFFDYLNVVYMGNNEVKDGEFSVSFNVPLDISYAKDNGKMNFYAYDEETGMDANGSYSKYQFSGTGSDLNYGDEGPEILSMFLNSESFKDGDNVNETPFFVARVFDEEGINMTGSGLGHDITICIDNSANLTYTLNSYYTPIDENEGEIKFSIPALSPGKHQLVFKVWDILNNSSTDSLTFNVVAGLKPHLYDITATNVPARDNTYFLLSHDRPESEIEVEVSVYDLAGRAVWTRKEVGSSSWLKQYPIEWNLTDGSGQRVGSGVYLYRAVINTPEGKEVTKSKKIIVLGQ